MKVIHCPKCDKQIIISDEKMEQAKIDGKLAVVCGSCGRQIKARIKSSVNKTTAGHDTRKGNVLGQIIVLENGFGYRQSFAIYEGANHIGRRNKDTDVDIPVLTGDPSMGRHHAVIKAETKADGTKRFAVKDDDSLVGTFVGGRILGKKEWAWIEPGEVITLGATSIILSDELPEVEQETITE